MRRATASFDFFQDRIGRDVAGGVVFAKIRAAVAVNKFLESTVEQFTAELVAKRVPQDRVHADEPRRQVADGKNCTNSMSMSSAPAHNASA